MSFIQKTAHYQAQKTQCLPGTKSHYLPGVKFDFHFLPDAKVISRYSLPSAKFDFLPGAKFTTYPQQSSLLAYPPQKPTHLNKVSFIHYQHPTHCFQKRSKTAHYLAQKNSVLTRRKIHYLPGAKKVITYPAQNSTTYPAQKKSLPIRRKIHYLPGAKFDHLPCVKSHYLPGAKIRLPTRHKIHYLLTAKLTACLPTAKFIAYPAQKSTSYPAQESLPTRRKIRFPTLHKSHCLPGAKVTTLLLRCRMSPGAYRIQCVSRYRNDRRMLSLIACTNKDMNILY